MINFRLFLSLINFDSISHIKIEISSIKTIISLVSPNPLLIEYPIIPALLAFEATTILIVIFSQCDIITQFQIMVKIERCVLFFSYECLEGTEKFFVLFRGLFWGLYHCAEMAFDGVDGYLWLFLLYFDLFFAHKSSRSILQSNKLQIPIPPQQNPQLLLLFLAQQPPTILQHLPQFPQSRPLGKNIQISKYIIPTFPDKLKVYELADVTDFTFLGQDGICLG